MNCNCDELVAALQLVIDSGYRLTAEDNDKICAALANAKRCTNEPLPRQLYDLQDEQCVMPTTKNPGRRSGRIPEGVRVLE